MNLLSATMIRTVFLVATVIGSLLAVGPARAAVNIEQIVRQKIQPILPKNGEGGGLAVAVQMISKTSFFNNGMANNVQNRQVTAASILNLGFDGKMFATSLFTEAVYE